MGRPRKSVLSVSLYEDRGNFCLKWGRGRNRIRVRIGSAARLTRDAAERKRDQVQGALYNGQWPEWAMDIPKIRDLARGPQDEVHDAQAGGDLLELYAEHLQAIGRSIWWKTCITYLRELRAYATVTLAGETPDYDAVRERFRKPNPDDPDLSAVTARIAQSWVEWIPTTESLVRRMGVPRSRVTANHMIAAASGFYRWCVDTGRLRENPFSRVAAHAQDDGEVLYLTVEERNRLLAEAERHPGEAVPCLAVWLPLYAGLRRTEVEHLEWTHVNLRSRKIRIVNQKSPKARKKSRLVDIAGPLLKKLQSVPPARRRGRVIRWPGDDRVWSAGAADLTAWLREALCGESVKDPLDPALIDFRVWRHTFGTLHALSGTKVYTLIRWMGISYTTFMRYYGGHLREYDEQIDAVDVAIGTENEKALGA